MWPEVLADIVAKIDQCMIERGEVLNVYLGASAIVPRVNQVNVIWADFKPDDDDPVYCEEDCEHNLVAFVEIWGYSDVDTKTASYESDFSRYANAFLAAFRNLIGREDKKDVFYENQRTLAGCRETARLSKAIRGIDFTADKPGYSLEITGKEGDQGQFRPTCGERIQFLIEIIS